MKHITNGHDLFALERFLDDTRHMIEFDVLSPQSPMGSPGDAMRLFLSDEGYAKALIAAKRRHIKITKHARVIEGHILYDSKKKRR